MHLWNPDQIYHSKEFRLEYAPKQALPFISRQTDIVEVRGSKTISVPYQRGISNLLQYERVLLTAKGDACEKLEVFRPSETKLGKRQDHTDAHAAQSIHEAVHKNELAKVKALLNEGVGVNQIGVGGYKDFTPLQLAANYGHPEMVKLLLANGADVNARLHKGLNATPLHLAAEGGKTDVAKILLANGANVNVKKADGVTALYLAAQLGHLEIVKTLLAKGAKIRATVCQRYGWQLNRAILMLSSYCWKVRPM